MRPASPSSLVPCRVTANDGVWPLAGVPEAPTSSKSAPCRRSAVPFSHARCVLRRAVPMVALILAANQQRVLGPQARVEVL